MNSENVDTEPSLQMHKLPSVLFLEGVGVWGVCVLGGGGGGGVHFFLEGGRGKGTLCTKDNTVCRP